MALVMQPTITWDHGAIHMSRPSSIVMMPKLHSSLICNDVLNQAAQVKSARGCDHAGMHQFALIGSRICCLLVCDTRQCTAELVQLKIFWAGLRCGGMVHLQKEK